MSELQFMLFKAQNLTAQLVESGGEITTEMESELINIDTRTPAAVDAAAHIISRMKHEEAYWKEMADKYSAIAKGCKTAREKMSESIKEGMRQLELKEIAGKESKFTLANAKAKLVVNEDLLDLNYLVTKTITEPDKERIRTDLEQGLEVEGAMLLPSYSLTARPNRGEK